MKTLLIAIIISTASALAQSRPNILFILSDDQRSDTIAGLGNPVIQTPNLDRLVARGTAFTNAHIMGGMQGAICVPSRAAILTGRTLFRCPEQPANVPVWPATFAEHGYTTFQTGKWHNGPAALHHAFASSKNTFFGGMNDHSKIPLFDMNASKKYPKAEARIVEKYDGEIFADTAIAFIESQAGADKPWFCWLSFTNPHDPRTPPGEYAKMYDPAKMPLPKNYMSQPPVETGVLGIRDEKLLPIPRTPDAVRKEIADYYGSITHMDAQIGRVIATLEKSKQLENTLIIFAGDNGLALGSHGLLGKQNVYQHSVGVPLVFAGPGVKNAKLDALVYLLDLFPTVCELTAIKAPQTVEGQSFANVLTGKPGGRDHLFFAYTRLHRGVRDARWKLIEWHSGNARTVQLFDLKNDADELRDLANDATAREHRDRLIQLLAKAKKDLGDPLN